MDSPDKAAEVSTAPPGVIEDEPDDVTAVVVKDEESNPVGILEKWSAEAWIYAEAEDLREL